MKMYFKGASGIKEPVDIEGNKIEQGSILTSDYGDYETYMHVSPPEIYKTRPFYVVKQKDNGDYYAESIDPIKDHAMGDKRFYLHDFRFKFCKVLIS